MAIKALKRKEKTKEPGGPPKGRRYVGTAETVGFIMFAASNDVRQPKPEGEWIDRLLDISKGTQALVRPIMIAWDVINDLFAAAIIEKTRTRFGKFRPYLLLYPLYGLPMTLAVFLLPYLFWQTSNTFLPKVVAWAAFSMFNELTATFYEITRMGMLANITPDPQERLWLITKSKFLAIGASWPKQIFRILRDVISRNTVKTALEVNATLRTLFTVMGILTMCISAGMSLYYAMVSRERVVDSQSEEKPPSIRESFVGLKNNRPLLMLMLSLVVDGFNIRSQLGLYVDSVLNFTNFGTVFGIPGGFISTPSYFYVKWLRERFSTKTLWIAAENITKPYQILIYFFGMIRTKTPAKGNGFYRMYGHLVPMVFAYMVDDMIAMTLYGTKRVIPDEIRNEVIDYGEWKNGFRNEAMVGMMRGWPAKISGAFGASVTDMIVQMLGFQTGENFLKQTEKTANGIFAMATIVPALTGMVALLPKFLYPIDQKQREIMYAELTERREATLAAIGVREERTDG
ncbi:MAG: MFS transporter [Oscillospiraceae bacterium]|nr:MFS transporter [Oscillospiraceae bacterium]